MISALAAYSKTVIGFFILAAFAELLLPGEKWQKYGRLVLGLLLLAALLEPLGDVLKTPVQLPAFSETEPAAIAPDPDAQEEMVLAVYEAQVADALCERLALAGADAAAVSVQAEPDGCLQEIRIRLQAGGPGQETVAQCVRASLTELGLVAEENALSIER